MLNYNHLRYFWAVAKEGHLTRAAEHLNVSQSALSAQIRKLEHQIGHPLFERRGRNLVLTEAGKIALDYADAIFATGEEMLGRLGRSDVEHRSIIRVGALATLSRNFQLSFLRPMLLDPDIEVIIRSGTFSELLGGLEAHSLDVLLVNQVPLRDSATNWTAHILDEQEVALIGTPHRVAGRTDYAELLASEPLIVPTPDSGFRNAFDILVERLGLQPLIAAEVDDMAMMRLLAREDIGLAVLPSIVVTDELASGLLLQACQLPGIHETFSAITLKRRFEDPSLKARIEQMSVARRS
jgi:LysR family transcriptional regulator, transcriptional activator of nhaA